jgi:two-component SAPR family response regulator
MKIMTVDNEKLALEGLTRTIQKVLPSAETVSFIDPEEALEYGTREEIDIAFLDINMNPVNGVELARNLKQYNQRINIIFTTGYSEYTGDAMKIHASGYIMKPVTIDKVRKEINDLRYPLQKETEKLLRVQTFGNFEVFADNEPIHFAYTKTKELLAYLIDRRGSLCTNGEIMAILWEDDASEKHTSYLKNLRKDLRASLEERGCGNVLIRRRGMIGIVPSLIDCDFYEFMAGRPEARQNYAGEYMAQYSWAEFTHAELERLLEV